MPASMNSNDGTELGLCVSNHDYDQCQHESAHDDERCKFDERTDELIGARLDHNERGE